MNYSKYLNKLEYPNSEVIKKYEEKITQEALNTVATGKDLKRLFDSIPEKVRLYKKDLMDKHCMESNRLFDLFRSDALEEAELSHLPSEIQDRIFSIAWSDGHSSGYSEVFNCLLNYSDIFKGYVMTKIDE